MFTQGKLYENTIDTVVRIEVLDELNELGCSGFCRDLDMTEGDPDLLCGLGFHTDIGRRVGALASLDDDELWFKTGENGLFFPNPFGDVVTNRSALG